MHFSGKKKIKLLFIIVFSVTIYAENANQYLGDQKKDYDELEALENADSAFVPGSYKKEEDKITKHKDDEEGLSQIPGIKQKEGNYKESAGDFGVRVPFKNPSNYMVSNNREIFKDIYRRGRWALSFNYIMDDYDVKDPGGIYQKTFVQSAGASRYGGLLISLDRYFSRGAVDWAYGFNGGIGMSKGRASFSTSQTASDTFFTLWSIPADFSLTMEIPMGRFMNLALSGGPSVMGLYQNRTDKESGEKYKYRRQLSPGYFALGKLKISLGNMFSSSMFSLFSDYKITNYYFNIVARHQSYSNFQDEITISGTSIGAGFTFDYL